MTTDFPDTHPYRYQVWYTVAPGRPEVCKQMAFTEPQDVAGIQARDANITVTRIETSGATR